MFAACLNSCAVITSSPLLFIRPFSCRASRSRTSCGSYSASDTTKRTSTFVLTLFTFWPPAPDALAKGERRKGKGRDGGRAEYSWSRAKLRCFPGLPSPARRSQRQIRNPAEVKYSSRAKLRYFPGLSTSTWRPQREIRNPAEVSFARVARSFRRTQSLVRRREARGYDRA